MKDKSAAMSFQNEQLQNLMHRVKNMDNLYGKRITELMASSKNHHSRIVLMERNSTAISQEFQCHKLEKKNHFTLLDERTRDFPDFKYLVQKQIDEVQQFSKYDQDTNQNKIKQIN